MSQLESLFDEFNQEEQQPSVPAQAKTEAGAAQPSETYTKSMLFVRGIPKDATNEELEEFFSNVGPIRSCFVVGEKKTEESKESKKPAKDSEAGDDGDDDGDGDNGEAQDDAKDKGASNQATVRNRGFGFVQFVLAEDAARAIDELANVKFRDQKHLMLDFAMKKLTRDGEDTSQPPRAKRPRPESQKSKEDSRPEKKPKVAGTKVESRTITIEGIPKGVTKQQLIKKVKKSGTVNSVFYPAPFSGATPEQLADGAGGSASVTFETHGMAQRAIKALNDHIFKGAKLAVKLKSEYIDKNARIIVRNLPFKVRERELEHIFSESGTVLKVDLPRKYVGGPLRGFAFIQMGDYESAERAIARWDEHKLEGRAVSVSFAIAKDKFKEMEEKGEIVRPEFASDAEASEGGNEDAAMDSEGEGEDELGDEKAAMDEDGEKEVGEDSEEGDDDEDIVDESLQQGCTLFIRNLSFDSDEDGLFEHFRAFGKLRYCRIVFDPETGRSRGTAFVCFWNPSDAAKCLEAAEKAQALSDKLGSSTSAAVADTRNKSVLLQEAPASLDATSQFTLDGRLLSVSKAVDRNTATDLATEGLQKRKSKDKRNLYLLKEGIIFPDSPAATAMAPPDLEQHSKEYGVRKNQLLKNPNLYLSKTRLSVHNIPRPVDDAALRSAAMSAVSKFKQEVKDKKRQPLSQDEMAEGWDKRPSIVQAKIVRSTDRIDVNTGKPRSMGYGFIEFKTHAHALACLRYLNFSNTKQAFSKSLLDEDKEHEDGYVKSGHKIARRSLRVMFSIENAQIVKKRELRANLATRQRSGATDSQPSTDRRSGSRASGKPSGPKKGRPSSDRNSRWNGGKSGQGKRGGGSKPRGGRK